MSLLQAVIRLPMPAIIFILIVLKTVYNTSFFQLSPINLTDMPLRLICG